MGIFSSARQLEPKLYSKKRQSYSSDSSKSIIECCKHCTSLPSGANNHFRQATSSIFSSRGQFSNTSSRTFVKVKPKSRAMRVVWRCACAHKTLRNLEDIVRARHISLILRNVSVYAAKTVGRKSCFRWCFSTMMCRVDIFQRRYRRLRGVCFMQCLFFLVLWSREVCTLVLALVATYVDRTFN